MHAIHTYNADPDYRLVDDSDIDAYVAYRSKLAAIATPGDPPPRSFNDWFQSRHQALPLTPVISDQTADFYHRHNIAHPAARPARAAA